MSSSTSTPAAPSPSEDMAMPSSPPPSSEPKKEEETLATTATTAATTTTEDATPEDAVPEGYERIREGQISMLYPKIENSVFYNPVQVQNRDLSAFMIGLYAERRAERMWTTKKRKEVRAELRDEIREAERGSKAKEVRKALLAELELQIDERISAAKKEVNFVDEVAKSSQTADGLSVLDALAASGLRSLRFWKEIPGVRTVVINDMDPAAVEMAKENVERNGFKDDLVKDDDNYVATAPNAVVSKETDEKEGDAQTTLKESDVRPRGIQILCGDATHEMYVSRRSPTLRQRDWNPTHNHQKPQYDVIDLDPYGSAAPFVDAAVQSVVNGGMLAVTCTDMAALGGSHPETCYGRYAGFPIQRAGYLQELALRILLYELSVAAARYGRTIRPILSVGMAFYVRVFVEVYDDKAGVNDLSLKHGLVHQSTQCSTFHVVPIGKIGTSTKSKNVYKNGRGPSEFDEPVCGETSAPYKIAGPCWTGPLHDVDIVTGAVARLESAAKNEGSDPGGGVPRYPLHTAENIHGLLVSVSEELPDVPLYHVLPSLCSAVNSTTVPMAKFRAAIVNAGYRISSYHKEPQAVKTDAPNYVVWDIIRAWCKENPPAQKKAKKSHGKSKPSNKTGDSAAAEGSGNKNGDLNTVANKILTKEFRTEVDFTIPKGLMEKKKARRFPRNPEAHWGPKKAASGKNKRKPESGDDEVSGEPDAKVTRT